MSLSINLSPYTKSNSKWVTDLNAKHKIIMIKKKKRRKSLGSWAGQRIINLKPKALSKSAWKGKTDR